MFAKLLSHSERAITSSRHVIDDMHREAARRDSACKGSRACRPSGTRSSRYYQAPLERMTAGIVLSRIDRSTNTDQRST